MVVKKTVSEQKDKPVLDEQTLARLLEAAYVLQEHNREFQKVGLNLELQSDQLREQEQVVQPAQSPPSVSSAEKPPSGGAAASEGAASSEGYTLTLAQIVETQRQIQVRHLEFENAMALVAERVTEITQAGGAAIGILDGKKIRYRGAHGAMILPPNSEVPMEKALCAASLRTGQVIRCSDVNPEFLLDPEECQRRGIASLIAVPIYHDGAIVGALELYFATMQAFSEQDVHTSQLMAGLVTEAFARDEELTWKRSLATERAAMLDALEKLKPNLAALMGSGAPDRFLPKGSGPKKTAPAMAAAGENFVCRKCGHKLVGEEQFCGECGAPRASEHEPPSLQSGLASLWNRQQAQKEGAGVAPSNGSFGLAESLSDSARTASEPIAGDEKLAHQDDEAKLMEFLATVNLRPDSAGEDSAATKASVEESEEYIEAESASESPLEERTSKTPGSETALTKTDGEWTSAAKAREFLEQLAASKGQGAFASFWRARRGDVYLAVAVVLVAVVIRWGIWSDRSVGATGGPTASTAAHRRSAPDADLSLFDKFLISMGLADPPETPEDKGNPDTQVWVDLHTALYYCPGTDLYGKTPKGKYTSQRDAQLDQFEPAYRKACE